MDQKTIRQDEPRKNWDYKMQDTNYWHGNMESKYIDAKKTLQTSFSPSLSIQTFSYQQNFYVNYTTQMVYYVLSHNGGLYL